MVILIYTIVVIILLIPLVLSIAILLKSIMFLNSTIKKCKVKFISEPIENQDNVDDIKEMESI